MELAAGRKRVNSHNATAFQRLHLYQSANIGDQPVQCRRATYHRCNCCHCTDCAGTDSKRCERHNCAGTGKRGDGRPNTESLPERRDANRVEHLEWRRRSVHRLAA
jgi:hypothetical protein